MKISIHTMYFLPDFGSAPILINELASSLAARGHEVEIVATIPRTRPADMKGLLVSRRQENGFTVKRFWTNATPHPLGRLLAWNIYTAGTLLNLASLRKGDVIFLRTPPLQLGFTGFWARALRGARVLLNVQDIHPDLSIESGILKNPAAIAFAKGLEKWVYSVSDRIVVISDGFRQNLLAKGVPQEKMNVIPNWVDTDVLRPLAKDNPLARRHGLADKFVVMYSGTISISSDVALGQVLEAALLLEGYPEIRVVIVGEGLRKEAVRKRAEELGVKNVLFLPFQPYADLPSLLSSADVLLVPLDKKKSQMSVPSKLFNFMAAGRPVLGLATPESEVAAIIGGTRSGVIARPDDPEKIAAAVRALQTDSAARAEMGAAARRYVVENFSRNRILDAYERVIRDLAA